ncbi:MULTISPECIES: ribonuclease [unclassified Bacillus (in: firmicutes)]|uniref:ribonuclease n=1 Tax=unclassified Bacillus (in: firmicutes) TaxID=185979 RepID=UPI0023DB4D69|nr:MULTISPECIES: ribonuclease [unclassified Bacillus (in: firmicutes)]MCU4759363.1 ribonuclease [Bacillus cereus]MDF2016460.1 ribonuclease [Bacillus sp. Cr_R3]MDF2033714.1 ribonuclease [Bacillus sp. Cr_R16]
MGLAACSSNETASTSNDSKAEEKAQKEVEKAQKAEEKEKAKKEEQKETEKQRKQQEKEKKEQEKKANEEQKKQQEESKKQENSKSAANADKVTYENEIKPTIDEMIKEYDEIWNQDWRPIWGEASKDPESLDKNALKEKMESVTNRYDALSKKNTAFKSASKLTDPVLKEKIEKFRGEFGLATNYRSNAGRAVTQGIKGLAPMKDRMNEAQKSVKLSDQKLLNAVASLTEVESKLGVKR